MSAGKANETIKILKGAKELAAPIHDVGTESFKRIIESSLAQFDSHKEKLIEILRKAHGAAKPTPFNADLAWSRIQGLAHQYYAREQVKRWGMSAADREARCRKIAEALGRARGMIDKAIDTPALANDLICGWWEGTSEFSDAAGGFVDSLHIQHEFEKALESLTALHTGAVRAASGAHKGRGRPRGSAVLPPDYIDALALVYRNSTGSKPGAGDGPFAKFVQRFLSAMGRRVTKAHVIDTIKGVRKHSLKNPASEPSPFDD
jgi:hypothetical protein